jgi:K(+)-stimulated pyrophosphate-energized sodium pump
MLGAAGYFGMKTATKANIRTACAARKGLNDALQVAFAGGSVMGLSVVALALAGVGVLLLIYTRVLQPESLIADNVGDNVGNDAGMGADLFDSHVGAIVSAMILGVAWLPGLNKLRNDTRMNAVCLPLVVAVIGVLASIPGFFPRNKSHSYQWWGIAVAIVVGLIAGIAVGVLTEYYSATFKQPVGTLVDVSKSGPATTMIQELAVDRNSTTFSILAICAAIVVAYSLRLCTATRLLLWACSARRPSSSRQTLTVPSRTTRAAWPRCRSLVGTSVREPTSSMLSATAQPPSARASRSRPGR